MDIKKRIKELCITQGISMNQLEITLGFGRGYLSKLGNSTPNAAKIQKIADFFDVTVDYLLTGKKHTAGETHYSDPETAQMAQKIFENRELRMLFDASQNAKAEDLKLAHDMLLALKRREQGDVE